jgi:hypothetical protein
MQLQPIGLIGATLFIQFCVLILLFVTIGALPQRGFVNLRSSCERVVLGLAFITLGCLVLSDDLYKAWSPILGDLAMEHGISRQATFPILFVFDLVGAFWLVTLTGGSKSSPFTSVLLLVSSLAIFLREPALRFILYSLLAAGLYIAGLVVERRKSGGVDVLRGMEGPVLSYSMIRTDTPAHAIANLGGLLIATVTGFITRPAPM